MINEKTVIGACFLDPVSIDEAATILSANDFKDLRHQDMFSFMVELKDSGEPISNVSVINKFIERGLDFDQLYIGELMDFTPVASNIKYYAKKIKEKSILRRALQLSLNVQMRIDSGDTKTLLEDFEREVLDLGSTAQPTERRMTLVLKDVFKQAEQAAQNRGQVLGLTTGFTELDMVLGGLQPGKLYIGAGRPGMGKSAWAMNLIDHISVKNGYPSILYQLEMTDEELTKRELCSHSKVSASRLDMGLLREEDMGRLMNSAEILNSAEIYIDQNQDISIGELRSRARRAVSRHKCKLIVVDYLQLVAGKGGTRQEEVADVSRGLKSMAKELKVPVVALAQLSRELERRQDKRPIMSDLRESGGIEQDADAILFFYRDVVYNQSADESEAEIIIGKNRGGKSGLTIDVEWVGQFTQFLEKPTPTGRMAEVHR